MPPAESKGWWGAGQRVLDSLLALAQNRLELAALEFAEEKQRLLTVLLLGGLVFFFGLLTLLLLTLGVVLYFWETAGPILLAGFGAGYGLITLLAWRSLQQRLRESPTPFSATVEEFKRDRQCLPRPN